MAWSGHTLLMFSKLAYVESFRSFYTFYLIDRFGVSIGTSQLMLFIFFVSSAAGVLLGGIVGDKIGRYRIIWISILGPLPLTLLLPHVDFFWTGVLTVLINLIMERVRIHHDLRHGACVAPHRPGRWSILWAQLRDGGNCGSLSRWYGSSHRH